MSDASVKLGLDAGDFEKGLRKSERTAESSGNRIAGAFAGVGDKIKGFIGEPFKALAGGVALTAVFEMARGLLSFGTAIKDAADRTNLATAAFQELQFAFGQGGANAEQFEKGVIKFTSSIEDAKSGNVEMISTLQRLGLSWRDLFTLGIDEMFYRVAEAVKTSTDPARALADVMAAFGKSGARFLPTLKEGAEGLKALRSEADKVSETSLAAMDAIEDRWDKGWRNVKVKAIENLMGFKDWVRENMGDGLAEMNHTGGYGMDGTPDANANHGAGGTWDYDPGVTPPKLAEPGTPPAQPASEKEIPLSPAELKELADADARRQAINEKLAKTGEETAEYDAIIAATGKQDLANKRELMTHEQKIASLLKERAEVAASILEDGTKEDALAKQALVNLDGQISRERQITNEKRNQSLAAENAATADKFKAAVDLQKLPPNERAAAKRAASQDARNTKHAKATVVAQQDDEQDREERRYMDQGGSFDKAFKRGKFSPDANLNAPGTKAATLRTGEAAQSKKGDASTSTIAGMTFEGATFNNATISLGG